MVGQELTTYPGASQECVFPCSPIILRLTLQVKSFLSLWPHAGKKAYPWDLQQSIINRQGNVLTWKIWFEKIFAHSRWGDVSNNLNRSHHPFKILKIKAIRMTNEVFFYCKNKCINKSSTKIKARCSYTDVINNICNWNRMTLSSSKGKVLQRPERLP